MKKLRIALFITILLGICAPLFAEYNLEGKDVFPVHRAIATIYASRLGYKIVFLRADGEFGSFYVPLKWFGKAGGQGEIVWGSDPAYPSFTVFYVDGKFHHIRLYLLTNLRDLSWGVLHATTEEEKKFDVETLEIQY